jgi:hypothetical protein
MVSPDDRLDSARYGNGPAVSRGLGGDSYREKCEMNPIALRDLAILLILAALLISVLLALRATQPRERHRRH